MKHPYRSLGAALALALLGTSWAAAAGLGWPTLASVEIPHSKGKFDFLRVDPSRHRLLAAHEADATSGFVDLRMHTLIARVKVGGAVDTATDVAAKLYYVIDPTTNKVIAQWPAAPATAPHGLALDDATHRLYAAGANGKLVAIDTTSGSAAASVDITPKVDQIALDAQSHLLYCAGTDHMSVVRIEGAKLTRLGELATAATARNVAVDPATHAVWTTYTDGKSSFARAWTPRQQRNWFIRKFADVAAEGTRENLLHMIAIKERLPGLVIVPAHDIRAFAKMPTLTPNVRLTTAPVCNPSGIAPTGACP